MSTAFADSGGPDSTAGDFGPRPYTLTRGRTHASRHMQLETLVQTAPGRQDAGSLLPEHDQIRTLCLHPRSVAEVSALLGIPLGVMRVLLADLADAGLLHVHEQTGHGAPATMLNRLLRGLENL
ncbi:DUF742 domain-containing protein [Streptomyces sp. NBC_00096]|uniref:DUF742 domain-containing protein n=1 Tax=Streptomyces sp. NBC_00096 TaxID=2975650 RepID=UPI00324B8A35